MKDDNECDIASDLDDVIGGFNKAYIDHCARYYHGTVTYDEAYTFDMAELHGVPHDVIVERVRNFCHHHHDEILPIEGAFEAIDMLSEHHNLHLVTSRCESLRDITLNWQDGFLSKPNRFAGHHFTNGFGSLFTNRRSKLDVCREIGASLLIEDAPANAQEVAMGGIPVLLFDRPWNQGEFHSNVTRIYSWSDAISWIEANL